jgi:hypothetical protein
MRWLGWVIGGAYMTVAFRALSLPWPLAMLGTGVRAWLGILGRCLFAVAIADGVTELRLGARVRRTHQLLLVCSAIAVMAIGTLGWRIGWRLQQRYLSRAQ